MDERIIKYLDHLGLAEYTKLVKKADTDLQDNIDAEEAARKAADIELGQRIDNLDYIDTPVEHQFVTKVNETNGIISVSRSSLTESDVPSLHLTKISDVTASASEVNVLDGITATTTELNYVHGVTSNIQTQIDTHTSNVNNPHSVTKAQIELGDVINTGDSDIPVSGGTTKFTTGGAYTELAKKLDIDDVIDNTTTTTTNQALSANQGKVLNDRIDALETLGRYLSLWDCTTGLPETDPTTSPYNYKSGDYYRVSTVAPIHNIHLYGTHTFFNEAWDIKLRIYDPEITTAFDYDTLFQYLTDKGHGHFTTPCAATGTYTKNGTVYPVTGLWTDSYYKLLAYVGPYGSPLYQIYKTVDPRYGDPKVEDTYITTNYRPNGTQYITGTPSTTVETDPEVSTGDIYFYDTVEWKLQKNHISGLVTNVTVNGVIAPKSSSTVNLTLTKDTVGLNNVDNTSDATKKTSFTGSIASGNTGFTIGGDVYTALQCKQDNLPTAINDRYLHTNSETGNLEWAEAGKVDDVKVDGTTVVTNKVANIDLATPLATKQNNIILSSSQPSVSGLTTGDFWYEDTTPQTIFTLGGNIFYDNGDNGATYTFYDINGNIITDTTLAGLANAVTYSVTGTPSIDRYYIYNFGAKGGSLQFGLKGTEIGVTSTGVGTGKNNTLIATSSFTFESNSIFNYIITLNTNGYAEHNDWYIPSLEELRKLKYYLTDTCIYLVGSYWTSSESSSEAAHCYLDGTFYTVYKEYTKSVQPIRSI